jgi:hypothetical protein
VLGAEESAESMVATASWSSRLILQRPYSRYVGAAGWCRGKMCCVRSRGVTGSVALRSCEP